MIDGELIGDPLPPAGKPKILDSPSLSPIPSFYQPKGHQSAREQLKDIIIVSLMGEMGKTFYEVSPERAQQCRMRSLHVDEDSDDRVSVTVNGMGS